ncbi:MAG: MetQ/NlpA family ABC transporter substrate-binding protein [Bifidobacteriaceae bacterium]|nr:MetQ/NlpA family ABC transporter substrate-binding protein [Bifidobacteriaceae bacterium]
MRKTLSVVALAAATALAMAGCGGGDNTTEETGGGASTTGAQTTDTATTEAPEETTEAPEETTPAAEVVTLKVGVSPVPQGDILQFIQDNLAAEAGLNLDIIEFQDYILPNTALNDGDLDGNYFQHQPYLDSQVEEYGYDFYAFPGVHIEPLGLYAGKSASLDDIPDGAVIGVSNDPANQARGLKLLESAGLFTLSTQDNPTIDDLADNPHNIQLIQVEPKLLATNLQDFDYAVINGNYAIDAGLSPANDALVLESGENNPYANFLVVRSADKDNPALVKLNELLHSPEVKQFITESWSDGSVIAAF